MKRVKLGDHIVVVSGFAFDSNLFNDEGVGLPLVRIRDVGRESSGTYYSGEYRPDFVLENGDLLIGMDGEFRLAEWNGGMALLNQRVCKIVQKSGSFVQEYLKHVLPAELKKIEDKTPFVTVKHLSVKGIQNIEIPLPPLSEQKRIAGILDAADRLRQQDKALIGCYNQLAQSVFLEMFGDPVRNERGWEIKAMGEVSDARLGKMLDDKKQTGENKKPYIKNTNVQWMRFELDNLPVMDFTEKEMIELALKKGDVLVCEGGEVGRAAVWQGELDECYFQKALHRVRCDEKQLHPQYLVHWLRKYAEQTGFKDYVSTATIAHLTGEKLRKVQIPAPPLPLQQKFAEVIENIEHQKAQAEASGKESEALFQSLLQAAFKGEL